MVRSLLARRLGRLACRMRLHRWHVVTVIDKFDPTGVVLTSEQFEAARQAYPPPPLKPFEMPGERGIQALTAMPVWLGGAASLRGRVVESHKEVRCRRCGRPRTT